MLFSKQRSKTEAPREKASNQSSEGHGGQESQHKPSKATPRRWFSTFRPKTQLRKESLASRSSHGGSNNQNDAELNEKRRTLILPTPPLHAHDVLLFSILTCRHAGRSVNVNHRRSLSNVFKTVKAKYSRDKLDKNEPDSRETEVTEALESASPITKELITPKLEPRQVSPPPRLDVLSDYSSHDSSAEPSTFRAGLEKAVADINIKYETPSNSHLMESMTDTGVKRLTNATSLPFYARGSFRPRYQLPTFVDAPVKTAQSTAGELQLLSPRVSTESVRIGTKGVKGADEGGCHLPTLLLDGVLGPSFDFGEFMTPQQTAEPTVSSEIGDCLAKDSASSENSIGTVVCEHDANNNIELETDSNAKQLDPGTAASTASTASKDSLVPSVALTTATNKDDVASPPAEQVCQHRRCRSNSDQPLRSFSGSNFGSFDHQSLISEISSTEVRRLRSKSTSDNSESYSEIILNPRQASGSSQVSVSHEENIPSVSELVSKFRRMGSLPGKFPTNSALENPNPHPALRKVSRGKQFETYRSRFSNDSEGDSGLMSSAEEPTDCLQLVIPKTGVRDHNLLTSEDAGSEKTDE
ncbi:Mss4-like protein [Metarhizium robertsii ARSEF 23]|uniref:Mss4-like protein n=1 Tax=Metarhizium robertsii (strain ARSEF 23 / ATCC MYA-3075) TaxID=655844 RepID=A0A0B2XHJ7_METRA|nr:Mss4-like protein [Metarhizium robertsii ARSEF 23]KHO11454.1 Mss4-like protein [Metarhizium robertsii ARSEF 23]